MILEFLTIFRRTGGVSVEIWPLPKLFSRFSCKAGFLFLVSNASIPMHRPMNIDSTGNPGMAGAISVPAVVVSFAVSVAVVVMVYVVNVV